MVEGLREGGQVTGAMLRVANKGLAQDHLELRRQVGHQLGRAPHPRTDAGGGEHLVEDRAHSENTRT